MTDLGRRLEVCYTGVVFDVLRARGIVDTVLRKDVRPLDPSRTLAGPVFTMTGSPKPGIDPHESLLLWTGFLSEVPAGHVVVSTGQDDDRALMGELSAETLQFRGARGYITDGGCRDCNHIVRLGFPVLARYFTPRDVVGGWSPDVLEQTLDFSGVAVRPGDFVIADVDGAVVIPGAIAEAVVAEAEEAMQKENLVRKAILEGMSPRNAYQRFGKF